jgi:hypothetical protein
MNGYKTAVYILYRVSDMCKIVKENGVSAESGDVLQDVKRADSE